MFHAKPADVTLVMHYQGIGGQAPPSIHAGYGAQRGPKVLLDHGLKEAFYGTGFDTVRDTSLFGNFPGWCDAERIGRDLGKILGIGGKGTGIVGFPFNVTDLDHAFSAYLNEEIDWSDKGDKPTIKKPLRVAINNLELLRLIHTSDYLKSLDALMKSGGALFHFAGSHDGDIGALAAVARYLILQGKRLGMVCFDAHGDYNNPRISPSGNLHGMHWAVATQTHMLEEGYLAYLGSATMQPDRKINPKNILHVGGRAFDPLEILVLKNDANVWTMEEVAIAEQQGRLTEIFAQKYEATMKGVDAVVVSLDFDVLDPNVDEVRPGTLAVAYQEPNGLQTTGLKAMLRMIAKGNIPVIGLFTSELNPRTGHDPEEKSFDLGVDVVREFLEANR